MRLLIMALAASVAFGQTNRTFQLTQNENKQDLAEISMMLRATADIRQLSEDDLTRTITAGGTAGQIALAAWLVRQMDLPAAGPFSGVNEYRLAPASDDFVRVFYLTHASTPQQRQEILTAVRSVADVPRLFVYNARSAVAARGNSQQIKLAAWLVDQLNQPAHKAAPEPHEYKLPNNDVARVFELTYAETPQQLQEIATLIRAVGDIPRLFVDSARRAVALRATAGQVSLAAWLVSELDKPTSGAANGAAPQEYRMSSSPDDLVRVFYLAGSPSAQTCLKVAKQVRALAGPPRLFIYNSLGALAVRGTVGQITAAEKVMEEMKAL